MAAADGPEAELRRRVRHAGLLSWRLECLRDALTSHAASVWRVRPDDAGPAAFAEARTLVRLEAVRWYCDRPFRSWCMLCHARRRLDRPIYEARAADTARALHLATGRADEATSRYAKLDTWIAALNRRHNLRGAIVEWRLAVHTLAIDRLPRVHLLEGLFDRWRRECLRRRGVRARSALRHRHAALVIGFAAIRTFAAARARLDVNAADTTRARALSTWRAAHYAALGARRLLRRASRHRLHVARSRAFRLLELHLLRALSRRHVDDEAAHARAEALLWSQTARNAYEALLAPPQATWAMGGATWDAPSDQWDARTRGEVADTWGAESPEGAEADTAPGVGAAAAYLARELGALGGDVPGGERGLLLACTQVERVKVELEHQRRALVAARTDAAAAAAAADDACDVLAHTLKSNAAARAELASASAATLAQRTAPPPERPRTDISRAALVQLIGAAEAQIARQLADALRRCDAIVARTQRLRDRASCARAVLARRRIDAAMASSAAQAAASPRRVPARASAPALLTSEPILRL